MITIILLIISSILIAFYIWFKTNFNYWTNYPQIPSVNGKIFSGNFMDFATFKTNFSYHGRTLYEDKRFGKEAVIGIYGLYQPGLLIREPELIKSILIKDFDCFRSRSCKGDIHSDPIGALNLFFASYSHWRQMRLKLNSVFSNGNLKFMFPLLQKVGENLQQYLEQKGQRFTAEVKHISGRFTTDTISTTIMGVHSNALGNDQEYIYQVALKLVMFSIKRSFDFIIMFFAPKLVSILKPKVFYQSTEQFLRSCIPWVIKERERTGAIRNDLIDTFIKLKHSSETEDKKQFMENLIAQAGVLMAGGYETSSTTLAYALFELAKDQEVQHKLRQEILHYFKEDHGEISYESLNKIEYLQMVIDETLRLYPVFPLIDRRYEPSTNRSSTYSLNPYYDYDLPPNMPVYISIYGLHYDPKVNTSFQINFLRLSFEKHSFLFITVLA